MYTCSLNENKRKLEARRIKSENEALAKRLIEADTHVSKKCHIRDFLIHQQYLERLSRKHLIESAARSKKRILYSPKKFNEYSPKQRSITPNRLGLDPIKLLKYI